MVARAQTETEAASLACFNAGQPPLTSLDTDTSVRARACRRYFPAARDSVLREKWWSFAKGWVVPAPIAGESLGPLKKRYVMPEDCLRVRYIQDLDDDAWDLENATVDMAGVPTSQTVLVTNVTAPVVAYTKRITEVRLWDPVFLDGFAEDLAARIALKVGRSQSFADKMASRAAATIATASAIDGREQSRQTITRTPSWVAARRGVRAGW